MVKLLHPVMFSIESAIAILGGKNIKLKEDLV